MLEDRLSASELEAVAARSLAFQRYIFRRAWGVYYAVWSAALAGFVFGSELPLQSLVPPSMSWVSYALFYGAVGWGAGIATAWIFSKAGRTVHLRKAVGTHQRGGRRWYVLMWIWWFGFSVVALVSFGFFAGDALSILYASLFPVEIFIYYQLKLSFPDRIPLEGRLAFLSYGSCLVISFIASLFTSDFILLGLAWGVTIVVWLLCALYALWHAPEELAALVY